MIAQDYHDPDSDRKATLHVHAEGPADVAVLQLQGTGFRPLSFAAPSPALDDAKAVLCSYPFGISQAQVTPRLLSVVVSPQGNMVRMEHTLDPGESGAPLLNADGRVVAVATSADQDIPIQAAQKLIP
jgi:S1-C subfamily serine protease